MSHRCLIVDDEPLAIEVIERYLGNFEDFEIAGRCSNAAEALSELHKGRIDLIFLDIEMPELRGTDFIRALPDPPKVIFTTAHRDFALEGFELDALDYLLKPVSLERFVKAIERYLALAENEGATRSNDLDAAGGPPGGFINIRADRKTLRLPIAEIIYIEGMKDYINIVSTSGSVSTNMTLQGILDLLPHASFLRIHRSYIVSVTSVTAFDSETVELGKKQLPIGRHYRTDVLEVLNSSGV